MIKNEGKKNRLSIVDIKKKTGKKRQEDPPLLPQNEQLNPDQIKTDDPGSPTKNADDKTATGFKNGNENVPSSEYDDYFHNQNTGQEDEINIAEYLRIFWQYKILIIAIVITAVIAAISYTVTRIPEYESASEIFIKKDLMELEIINNKPMFKQSFDIKTWIKILSSTEIAEKVETMLQGKRTAKEIQSMVSCSSDRDEEHVINLKVRSTDPGETASIANLSFLALKEYDAEVRNTGFYQTIEFLKSQLEAKQNELNNIEKMITDFYQAKNIDEVSVDYENNLSKVDKFTEMLQIAEVDYSAVTATIIEINSNLDSEDNEIIAQTTYSEPLKIRLMNLEVDLARSLTQYTEKHPRIIAIQENIDNVKQMIKEGAEDKIQLKNMASNPVKQQLINDLMAKQGEAVALKQKIAALRKIIAGFNIKPEYRLELAKLQRERDGLKSIIISLQNQLETIGVSASVESNRIYQLQKAFIPKRPCNINLKMNLLIGLVLGFGLGLGIALLLNNLDTRIKNISDFIKNFKIPLIGTVPRYKVSALLPFNSKTDLSEEEEIARDNQKAVFLNIFKIISLNIKYMQTDEKNKAYLVSSPSQHEGKSSIAAQLSASFAEENYKVILVDTDFILQKLTATFNLKDRKGLSEVLTAQEHLEDCIVTIPEYGFDFLPSGKNPPHIGKLFNNERFDDLISVLKESYNLIFLDTAALLHIVDTAKMFNRVDGVILIAKIMKTTYWEMRKTIKRITAAKGVLLGAILNYARNNIFDKEYSAYNYDYYKYSYGYGSKYGYEPESVKKKKKGIGHKLFKTLNSGNSSAEGTEDGVKKKASKEQKGFNGILKKIWSFIAFDEDE